MFASGVESVLCCVASGVLCYVCPRCCECSVLCLPQVLWVFCVVFASGVEIVLSILCFVCLGCWECSITSMLCLPQVLWVFRVMFASGVEIVLSLLCYVCLRCLECSITSMLCLPQVLRCGFKIGGGIDQDFQKSPQGYTDNGIYCTEVCIWKIS